MSTGRSCGPSPTHDVSLRSNSAPRSGRTPSRSKVLGDIRATVTRSGASPSVSANASLVKYAPRSVKERALNAK